MIIIRFSGGLGNQIYQYALLKRLQLSYPDAEIRIDLSFYQQNHIHNGFELDKVFGIFEKGIREARKRDLLKVKYEIPFESMERFPKLLIKSVTWANTRSRFIFTNMHLRNEIKEEFQNLAGNFEKQEPEKLNKQIENIDSRKHCYIDGYWQNELFFREVLSKVLEELHFPDFQDNINIELENQIRSSQAVSIHVRRGDYVNSNYDVLTPDYYKNAIQYIKKTDVTKYFIFTDDVKYVEQEFGFLKNKYIVRNNKGEASWCDLKLMSLCRYNILANSSFSNWAGYFNKNNDKIIVYPSQYTKTEKNTDKFGKEWVKIDV
jgi:hypothetical protein